MSTHRNRRLRHLAAQVDAVPIPKAAVQEAFDAFCRTGELTGPDRLAAAVLHRARTGQDMVDADCKGAALAYAVELLYAAPTGTAHTILAKLCGEAMSPIETVRVAARDALAWLVRGGFDMTKPDFEVLGIEAEVPRYGSVGLQLLGFPACLAVPPYEERARQLIERLGTLREQTRHRSSRWFDQLAQSIGTFRRTGELPEERFVREVVLADAELLCLIRHRLGLEVGDWMDALQIVQTAAGDERDAALARLQELARGGGLLPLSA